jgi:DNA-binding Lrp family transcriptional regulator
MDGTDKKILDMIKGDARKSYQEIGDELGISRVAARKRVDKLEKAGIIRQYNTYIKRDDEITMLIDIITKPEGFDITDADVVFEYDYVKDGEDT